MRARRVLGRLILVCLPVLVLTQAARPYAGLPTDGVPAELARALCPGSGSSAILDYVAGPTPYDSLTAAVAGLADLPYEQRRTDVRTVAVAPDHVLMAAHTADGQIAELLFVSAFPEGTWGVGMYQDCAVVFPPASSGAGPGTPPVGESPGAR